jgi:hypothetical protein
LAHSPSAIPALRIPENAESVIDTIKLLLNNDPKTINQLKPRSKEPILSPTLPLVLPIVTIVESAKKVL